MNTEKLSTKEILIQKGVIIPEPRSVEIGEEVDPERISADHVIIHAGSKINGASTLILQGARIGGEAPASLENCYVGPGVTLAGGFFKQSVFLKKAQAGSGAQVREGTILEEMASIAHTVGLKQTILFPFVTLGSLINFCDCLMSGGTGRKNHSEVGSSYIHFNFTPNQDKATPSLLGDVPKGVMLKENPIFLGGQGGLVGPCRIAFGTVIGAGSIFRKDMLIPDKMILQGQPKDIMTSHTPGLYRSVKRIFLNNLIYIGNLVALSRWYVHVRVLFSSIDSPDLLLQGCIETLNLNIKERISRLGLFSEKLLDSAKIYEGLIGVKNHPLIAQKLEIHQKWPEVQGFLQDFTKIKGQQDLLDRFLSDIMEIKKHKGNDYLTVIRALDDHQRTIGTRWLQGIVDEVVDHSLKLIPSMGVARQS
jgi:UDP-N-acetylglucosamine/UDP-N-acetylgalactosamine diphosphorylase